MSDRQEKILASLQGPQPAWYLFLPSLLCFLPPKAPQPQMSFLVSPRKLCCFMMLQPQTLSCSLGSKVTAEGSYYSAPHALSLITPITPIRLDNP